MNSVTACTTKVSVIIPARNESQNIGECLESIIDQTYSPALFEIIVVDDHSTDETAAIVSGYMGKTNVKLVMLSDELNGTLINSYKKKAIEAGIKKSTGDLIVTTDADCVVKPGLLSGIVAFYEKYKPAFIAGPGSFYG